MKKNQKNNVSFIEEANKNIETYTLFNLTTSKNTTIEIERTSEWEINITQTAKKLNKRWRNWKKWNAKLIETYEELEGRALIRETDDKRNPQTFLSLVLALRVLNDYDPVLSYHVFKSYEQEILSDPTRVTAELLELKQKLQIADAKIASLEKSPINVNLEKGKYLLYGYECNDKTKFGTSFTNKNGQRPKSHKTSVPDLSIGFVIYSSKENLQELNKVIKSRFKTKTEHLNCSVDDLEGFILEYCKLMEWEYRKEDIHTLKLLNIYLSS